MENTSNGTSSTKTTSAPDIKGKVALWANWDIRDNGTCRRLAVALGNDMGLSRDRYRRMRRPVEREADDPTWADLNLFVDDGRDDIEWLPPSPNACWLIDTHLGWDTRRKWAGQFDTVFTAQKDAAAWMQGEGLNAFWLPLACSPQADIDVREAVARKIQHIRKVFDVCFVGFLNRGHDGSGHDRVEYLDRLFKAFPNFEFAFNRFFEDAAVKYLRSRVGFNVSIRQDLNMRFFEILSYGVAQLCNRDMAGMEDLGFVEGEHYFGYSDPDEMVDKVRWMLSHPTEREEVARRGHEKVRSEHTYRHRAEAILKTCGLM